jgi:hypothetical protein
MTRIKKEIEVVSVIKKGQCLLFQAECVSERSNHQTHTVADRETCQT